MPDDHQDDRIPFRILIYACGAFTAAAGVAALAGWVFEIPRLACLLYGLIPMAPSTAALFALFGAAVVLYAASPDACAARGICTAIGLAGIALGAPLTVLSYLNIHPMIEHLGIPISGELNGAPLGHISPATALCFVVAGVSFLALLLSYPNRLRTAQVALSAALVLLAGCAFLLIAYLLGAPMFYGGRFIPPALTTVLAFTALGLALAALAGPRARPAWKSEENAAASHTLALVFIVLSFSIIATGYIYSHKQEKHFRAEVEKQLATIADMKVIEIARWREERFRVAGVFYRNKNFSELVRRYFNNPGDGDARERIEIWLRKMHTAQKYDRVCLHDASGAERLSAPDEPIHTSAAFKKRFSEVMRTGKPAFQDFYRDEHDGRVYLSVLVPIIDVEDGGRAIGALALRIDPHRYLYPFIERWPTPSRTAETLIVRRDGDDVLFLNELKYNKEAALKLRIPLKNKNLPAVKAVLGRETVEDGVDYRGARVLAATRMVHGSPWAMVARMDLAEVYEPLRERLWVTAILVIVLLGGAGAGTGLVWRREKIKFFRDRFEAAENLRQSEERYRTTLDNMMEGFQIIGKDWRYLYVNDAAAAHGKRKKEEITGQTIMQCYPGIENTGMFAALRRCMDEQTPCRMENEFAYPDGSRAWFELSIQSVSEGVAILSIDITENKKSRERIAHLNRVLRAIRDVNQLIVREKDPEKMIREACALMVEHRGYRAAIIIRCDQAGAPRAWAAAGIWEANTPVVENLKQGILPNWCAKAAAHDGIFTIRDHGAVCGPCPLAAECAKSDTLSIRLTHGARAYGYLAVSLDEMPGTADREEESLFLEMAGDVAFAMHTHETEKGMRRAEKERDHIQAELLQSQKMEAVGRLAGGIAHDFNNMLTVINNYAAFAISSLDPDDPLMPDMKDILAAGEKAAQLTQRLLAFSRRQILAPVIMDIGETVKSMESMMRRIIGEDIDLEFYNAGGIGRIKADPGQIEQILMNLVVNARDAMPHGGKITIDIANVPVDEDYAARHQGVSPGDYVMLSVADTGMGMDEATMSNIFDPFFTTKAPGKGTGLGLSTVYGIVKQSGGHIWVYSEPGKGTTFKAHFPRELADKDAVAQILTKAGRATGTETILVVEDEKAVRDLVKRVLAAAGYDVHTAADGEDALGVCEQLGGAIRLLLTDVVMPGISGRRLAEQLLDLCPDMKVLFMSGYTENAIVHHGVLDQGIQFISKPFSGPALAQKVRDILDA